MPHRVVQNTVFLIQSAVLTGMLIFITVSTKPSDVYNKLDVMESKVLRKLQANGEIFSQAEAEIQSIKVWNKETVQQLLRIQRQIDYNSKWIEERTKDRWTRSDQEKWEREKFGEVLDFERDPSGETEE